MYQKFICAGFLAADPEMRFTPQGQAVTNFRIGVSGYKDETMWIKVAVWGDQAESANKYLSKGAAVLVDGRLDHDKNGNPETYTSKDGEFRSSFSMTANYVKFLPRGERGREYKEESVKQVPW